RAEVMIALARARTLDLVFFFSSRRRHTRLQGDWSSDVCSSDLDILLINGEDWPGHAKMGPTTPKLYHNDQDGTFSDVTRRAGLRSEERRVGKEGRARWGPWY